ncbi:MAG: cyclic nucleotide-binding domain-containing protein [Rhodocyclaceae bacterium]|jgi:CRP-like cAMP-binding protein|nr:cyclic nucleotide-binding domain-containing protein [Rhodocyclaceae bacterium]
MDAKTAADPFAALHALGNATAHVDRIMAILEHIRLFEDFTRAEIEWLARYMRCYRADIGVEILREGEPGDCMLLLIEGSVEILKRGYQGLPQRLAVVGPGRTLGEMSLIDGEPRFASCITLAPTLFAVLDRDGLTRLIAEQPKTGIKLLMELVMLLNQRLRTVSGELLKCLDNQRLRIR